GLWVAPGEAAAASPTLTGFIAPKIASKANTPTFTVNGVGLVLRSFVLDMHNDVQARLLVPDEEIIIVDRAPTLSVVCEAVPLTTFNPFALAQAVTPVPVSLVHGTTAGNIATISAPTCQVKRPTGYQNNQGIAEWPLELTPLPATGNDELTIELT